MKKEEISETCNKDEEVSAWCASSLMLNLKMIGSNVLSVEDGHMSHVVAGPLFMCVLIAMAILLAINFICCFIPYLM